MNTKSPFPLRLYQQMEPAKSARGSLSASYAELTPMSELMAYDPLLIKKIEDYSGGYPAIFGSLELRKKVAEHLGVGPDDVIITNGIDDSLPSIYESLLTEGGRLSLLTPTYDPIPERAHHAGATVVTAQLENGKEGWFLNQENLDKLLGEDISICALNVPHNPTGWYPSSTEQTALRELAEKNKNYIIADEVYAGLPQKKGVELKSLATLSDQFISVGSLTKSFGLPGLRIGWIACTNPDVITQIKNVRTFTHCYISALSEMAAISAMNHAQEIIANKVLICRKNLDALDNFVAQFPAFTLHRPKNGTVCMAHFDSSKTRFSSASDMCKQLLEDRGLILIDNTFFDDSNDWVRFGFGVSSFLDLLPELALFLEENR